MIKIGYKEQEEVVLRKYVEVDLKKEKILIPLKKVLKKAKVLVKKDFTEKFDYESEMINYKKFYFFKKNDNLYITKNLNLIFKKKSKLFSHISRKSVIFYGIYSNIEKRIKNCDNVYLNDKIVGKVKRPVNFWKFKHIAIIKISLNDIINSGVLHSVVGVGDDKGNYLQLSLPKKYGGINYYKRKVYKKNNYILIRSTVNSSKIRVVNIQMQPEYTKINLFKNWLANQIFKIIGKKDIVLLFEKETNKANESGFYIFEKIMKLYLNNKIKTKPFFIINKSSQDYKRIKEKYNKNIIEKYTFKHYLYIYICKCFISSELSNHVINPRLYIKRLNKVIAKKPLIFLQHGIMFAKPVDNPAAIGFKKKNSLINFYKCVISSDLEATQFYKLGYKDEDLIKCGLTKFDISKQNKNADKIMLMLTYRYWEEGMVLNPKLIKETTYYKAYSKIIKEFEKNNLLDKLVVSCHPKFVEILKIVFNGKVNIEADINKGLEESKIFISDYSSASYDAHYRGAYIIYYWEEKDYLIENYQAIPPINEKNCDGVPVYNVEELIFEVKKAIKKNYVMDKKYQNRYKKINEFSDGKNGDRLIKELLRLGVLK